MIRGLESVMHFGPSMVSSGREPETIKVTPANNPLRRLEEHRTERRTYCFPPDYPQEEREGYYIRGYHMGLGEDRRKRQAVEIESTFRALKIQELGFAEQSDNHAVT